MEVLTHILVQGELFNYLLLNDVQVFAVFLEKKDRNMPDRLLRSCTSMIIPSTGTRKARPTVSGSLSVGLLGHTVGPLYNLLIAVD